MHIITVYKDCGIYIDNLYTCIFLCVYILTFVGTHFGNKTTNLEVNCCLPLPFNSQKNKMKA